MLEASQTYIAKISYIEANIFPPNKLTLANNLLPNSWFCKNLYCYQHSHFQLNQNQLEIQTEQVSIKLAPYVHISCTILDMDRTSIFHNELFKLDNGHLLAKNPTLPNLTRVYLYNPKIDTLTKKISTDFLLHGIVFPVFYLKKVAFQCLTPQILTIDGKHL